MCDNVGHCEDNSDERLCDRVRFPQSYDKLLPPTKRLKMPTRKLGPSHGHLAPVTANMKILDLLDIDEQQSTFDLYFKLGESNIVDHLKAYFQLTVDIMWFDVNLRYIFLNDLDDKNAFNEEELDKVAQNSFYKDFPLFSFFLVVATSHTILPCGK